MSELSYRQVHLDFHTSEHIPDIGKDFDGEQFAETLQAAHVDSITCFARCHHGWLYYPSKNRPDLMHPNLVAENLLLDQIDSCHRRGIKVPIYTTVQWDAYISRNHPEWLAIDENGNYINTQGVAEPHFYDTICLNSDYRDYFKAHLLDLIEVVGPERIDGLFMDILFRVDCHCTHCMKQMEARGIDTTQKSERLQYAGDMLDEFRAEISALIKERVPHAGIFYNSSHIGPNAKASLDSYTHLELESLPSGGWGYDHFPATARYARCLNKDLIGMTGKFHTYWGDFHSLKNKAALEFEVFQMLAMGTACSIGDQLHPNGTLSPAAYDLIGHVYGSVKELEPYCKHSKPVVEMAVLTPEEFTGGGVHPSLIGTVRMLQELSYQFNIIDSSMDLDAYSLLILPDVIPYQAALMEKIRTYVERGGKVIGTHESLQQIGQENPLYGHTYHGASTYDRDFVLPNETIGKELPKEAFVMYGQGAEVSPTTADTLMDTVQPYFNREGETFCSHQHAPSSGKIGHPAVTKHGNVIYFSHPIFRIYRKNCPAWCKQMLQDAVSLLLDTPLVQHDGPSTLLTSLHEDEKTQANILHMLHYITEKRSEDIYTIEDIIPLYHTTFQLRTADKQVQSVQLLPSGEEIPFEIKGNQLLFTVEKIAGYRLIQINWQA